MKRLLLILLVPFLLASCRERFQLKECETVEVIESEEVYLSEIPRELTLVNDSLIAFMQDNESILLLNTNSGKLQQLPIQLFDFKQFLKDYVNLSDTLVSYDLSKHPNKFVAQYPLIKVNSIDYFNNHYYLLYTITNPLYINRMVQINYANALITLHLDGKIKSAELVELFNPDNDTFLFTPDNGFHYIPKSNSIVCNAINETLLNSIVSSFKFKDGKYSFSKSEFFPYPEDSNIIESIQNKKIYPFEFRIHGEDIYFTNGKDLYSYTTGKKIINTDQLKANDSISLVKSFDIILNKRGKIKFFAFIEDIFPDINAFGQSINFLVITNRNGNKIVRRNLIGRYISGLVLQNNNLVFLEELNEKIIIRKYHLN